MNIWVGVWTVIYIEIILKYVKADDGDDRCSSIRIMVNLSTNVNSKFRSRYENLLIYISPQRISSMLL